MAKKTKDKDDEDLEEVQIYCHYEWDCPNCGEVNDDGDSDHTGEVVTCESCGERFWA